MSDLEDMNSITSFPVYLKTGDVVVTPKPWYKSKQLWWNALTMAAEVAVFIPPPAGVLIAGIGNILLRIYATKGPIK